MGLRPYQSECLDAIVTAKEAGKNRQLVSLPTGCGKTVIFTHLPGHLKSDRKTLILAHREELISQAAEKFTQANPFAMISIEMADRHATPFSEIIIASVPTLGRSGSSRIKRFWPEQFGLIITDEAHHATGETYQNIYSYFGLPDRKDLLHVGFTATPRRGDGSGLITTFEEIVFHRDIQQMIDEGWLSRITGRRVSTGTDLSRVRSKMGDFQEGDLAQAVNTDKRNSIVVKSYIEFSKDRKCLVFAVDTEHTMKLRDTFHGHGIRAEAVIGTTDREVRARTLAAFKSGEIQVLVNCMVLTEGFDEPSIETIIMARPTTSALLYTQMIGRGTRLFPGKTDCLIIDLVDNSSKHTVKSIPSLFGLPANLDLKGKDAREAEKKYRAFVAEHPHSRLAVEPQELLDLDQLNLESQKIDFFRPPTFPAEVLANSQLTWLAYDGGYVMSTGKGCEARILQDFLGQFEITLTENGQAIASYKAKEMSSAFKMADDAVKEKWPQALSLLDRGSKWRADNATAAQLDMLRRLKVAVPSGIKKGEASMLISEALAKKGKR